MSATSPSPLVILEDALSDVGLWRWWTEHLPAVFQLEFIGSQLRRQPADAPGRTEPVALRFGAPHFVAFLSRDPDLPPNWPQLLAQDALASQLRLDSEDIAINRPDDLPRLLAKAATVHMHLGQLPVDFRDCPVAMGFWAGGAGALIGADTIELAADQRYPIEEVTAWNARWWEYWRRYWELRGRPEALEYDWVCEVCIPIK